MFWGGVSHVRRAVGRRNALAKGAVARARSKRLLLGLKGVIGVLLIYLVLRNVDGGAMARLLSGVKVGYFMLACLLLSAGVTINSLRWCHVMSVLSDPIALRSAVVGNFEAMFFNQLLPTGSGGDAARMLRAYDAGAYPGWSVVGVLLDRALGLWFVALCIGIATTIGGSEIVLTPTFRMIALASAIVLLGGVGAAVAGAVLKDEWFSGWAQHLVTLTQSFTRVVRSRNGFFYLGGTLLASTVATVGSFIMVARALGVGVDWWNGMIILQCMVLASIIPVSIGGWGVREGVAILLFAGIGIGANEATAIAILFGLVLTAVGLVGGLVWMASGYRRFGRVPNLEKRKLDSALPFLFREGPR
jgi:glycosyltransferase 2 family protein